MKREKLFVLPFVTDLKTENVHPVTQEFGVSTSKHKTMAGLILSLIGIDWDSFIWLTHDKCLHKWLTKMSKDIKAPTINIDHTRSCCPLQLPWWLEGMSLLFEECSFMAALHCCCCTLNFHSNIESALVSTISLFALGASVPERMLRQQNQKITSFHLQGHSWRLHQCWHTGCKASTSRKLATSNGETDRFFKSGTTAVFSVVAASHHCTPNVANILTHSQSMGNTLTWSAHGHSVWVQCVCVFDVHFVLAIERAKRNHKTNIIVSNNLLSCQEVTSQKYNNWD